MCTNALRLCVSLQNGFADLYTAIFFLFAKNNSIRLILGKRIERIISSSRRPTNVISSQHNDCSKPNQANETMPLNEVRRITWNERSGEKKRAAIWSNVGAIINVSFEVCHFENWPNTFSISFVIWFLMVRGHGNLHLTIFHHDDFEHVSHANAMADSSPQMQRNGEEKATFQAAFRLTWRNGFGMEIATATTTLEINNNNQWLPEIYQKC